MTSEVLSRIDHQAAPHGLYVCLEIHLDGQKLCTSGLAVTLYLTVLEVVCCCGSSWMLTPAP